MKKITGHDPNRRAFVVFVVLVVFCLLQLSWWIVFQVDSSQQFRQVRLDLLTLQYGSEADIPADLKSALDRESHKRVVMFVSEGSFFMLIILTGAYFIYRTLRRSVELQYLQKTFIQSLTHEFRTPLTSLRLYLETLQKGNMPEGRTAEILDRMHDDCDRLDGMIDTVLETGYFDRHDYHLKLTITDLVDDVREYLKAFDPYVNRLGGRLISELSDGITVKSDYGALKRALRVLVENATNYSPPDRREVTVSLTRENNQARLAVADRGFGLTEDEKKKVFDRFYRGNGDKTKKVKGTGLGLFLARRIIEGHGGQIEATSDGPDKGSCFIISLPLAEK